LRYFAVVADIQIKQQCTQKSFTDTQTFNTTICNSKYLLV